MSDEEIVAKFFAQVQPHLGVDRADQLLKCLWRLEHEPSVERLFELMLVEQDDN